MENGKTLLITGAGGIGRAAALMLLEWADFPVARVYLVDRDPGQLRDALASLGDDPRAVSVLTTEAGISDPDNKELADAFADADVVLDCLPGGLAPKVARRALDAGCHYANLTEYVAETNEIEAMAEGAPVGFVLQTGLAPGFINVLAMRLYRDFVAAYGEGVTGIAMKVGALSQDAPPPHFYAFTWSEVGVATEYVMPSIAIRDGRKQEIPSLSERETLEIEGKPYEADLTSGGAANLPDYFNGKVDRVDYKTLRYPGHYAWVDGVLDEVGRGDPAALEARMRAEVPRAEDDVVVIHAAVSGHDAEGNPQEMSRSYVIPPTQIGGTTLRAIQSTTASALVESAKLLLESGKTGIILQTDIDPDPFMNGVFVGKVYR